ncbi:TetR/AcrR family transcriptional regulator [Chryseobacterium lactis]|uniref:TetR/AcrR family transcriptional regulator n=1 Tax=Chryseobacterium lactis TaxID=1241981 RepID=A0A3G6RRK7_CHRLC|nr:TetR/AcrR family transcriptional regulator [Chryseobacterium lactis]AZA84140.1 TetR/AcrR family transcriptional regulator [Chryseobacterium lactis]AZB04526.1 TetR/AcrR family transcriptional regulator [Chryseobacterium lactis]PNW12695.1 TetR/AcrR family transcriptional regulator [Chryseobacterium lactis]
MERKSAGGSIRNKERSKKKFLDAVGKILKTKGYQALKVNTIAATAGVDKKMIYTYFGGIDGLINAYIRSKDYWSMITIEEIERIKPKIDDGGKSFMEEMLLSQFDYVYTNKEAQKLLLWRISEPRKSLKKLTDTQEENGEHIFKLMMDPHFGVRSRDFRAILAIIVSGLYYLNLYAAVNGSIFCGIDIHTPKDRENIKKAISYLLEQSYKHLKNSDK